MSFLTKSRCVLSAVALSSLLLAGCSEQIDQVQALVTGDGRGPLPCPGITLVADASKMTRFNGNGEDLTDVVFSAEILDVRYTCEYEDDETVVIADMQVFLSATSGPANADKRADFDYFLGIGRKAGPGEEPQIVTRQQFDTSIVFQTNDRRVAVSDEIVPRIPLQNGELGSDYRYYVGLVLTKEELDYNRRNR
ncbi:hypothetical protein ACTL6U_16105 [Rhodovibrionaceae bacterium A322]